MKIISKILKQELRASSGSLLVVILLMLVIVGLEAIAPWPFKILLDNVLAPTPIGSDLGIGTLGYIFQSRDLLGFFAILVYFLSTFSLTVVEYVRGIVGKKVVKNLTSGFSKNAFKNLQSLAIGFYNKQQIGDYIYRLSYDVSALGELVEDGLLPLVTSGLYLLVTATIMFLISFKLTLLALAALPFLAIGLYSFNTYIAPATKRSEFLNSAAFSFIEEALTHLKIIQAFSRERKESKAFNEKIESSLRSDVTLYRLDFLLTLLVGIIIAVSYSIIILYGIRSVFSGTLTTGLLIVFIFYLDNLTNPILSIIDAAAITKQSYLKIVRMEDFFSPRTHLKNRGEVTTIDDMRIRFDHVTLRIGRGKKILNNVSFEIEPRKRTVVFGVNGSGKTSIVNLLMRFVDKPTSGKIFLGGIPLNNYDLKSLRASVAFVPQEITLFNDTIKNNIAFGSEHATLRDVERAAHLAAADGFINNLPGKYSFNVGEGGNYLSGGQRQRLMLARALMKKDAKILLFDETLSALDVKTRKEVIDNIYFFSRGKTTIVVSNIFAVVKAADNVIVLDKGRVLYSGPASHLPREISLYKMIIDNV